MQLFTTYLTLEILVHFPLTTKPIAWYTSFVMVAYMAIKLMEQYLVFYAAVALPM